MKFRSVAIDGPSGAGKSSIARHEAASLGFLYVDTGAIYRTVGLAAFRNGVASKDTESVISLLPSLSISLRHENDGFQHMFLNDEDVSQLIRMPEISLYASEVSAVPEVRAYLMEMQRKLAEENDVIMDGRDIGTVVLPNAGLKIFLTASPEARALRRTRELGQKGVHVFFEDVLKDINLRDCNDTTRAAAPLKAAPDAIRLDSTGLSFEESCAAVERLIKERFGI